MKKILVIGAGLSSPSLIRYLLEGACEFDWRVTVADMDEEKARDKLCGSEYGTAVKFDVKDTSHLEALVQDHDIVISMLPASMHYNVAVNCVKHKKNMVTASYVSDEIKSLDQAAKDAGIIILNEMGVDPGIDHMSAMQIIDRVKAEGGKLVGFESSTGGLIAPEHDNNPWNYKFTWNPRNVVVAGQGVSMFLQKGRYKYVPYHRLFSRVEKVNILDIGEFEIYPNRDSLKYKAIYGLNDIETLFRGTIRRPGYSEAWNVFVQLGLTDDTYTIEDSENMTYREFVNSYLVYEPNIPVETKLAHYVGIEEDSDVMMKIKWSGIFGNEKVELKNATPAQILQKLIEPKWQLAPDEKDMVVMYHIFDYIIDGQEKRLTASLYVKGQDKVHTAMAVTVGTPVAIGTKLILNGELNLKGVCVPTQKEVYTLVMKELTNYGVNFVEREVPAGGWH